MRRIETDDAVVRQKKNMNKPKNKIEDEKCFEITSNNTNQSYTSNNTYQSYKAQSFDTVVFDYDKLWMKLCFLSGILTKKKKEPLIC